MYSCNEAIFFSSLQNLTFFGFYNRHDPSTLVRGLPLNSKLLKNYNNAVVEQTHSEQRLTASHHIYTDKEVNKLKEKYYWMCVYIDEWINEGTSCCFCF